MTGVRIIDDFLDKDKFEELQHMVNVTHWSDTNHTLWSEELYEGDNKVDMTPIKPLQFVVDKFDEPYEQFANMLWYRYHPGSYILFHVDSGHNNMYNYGFTLYLNNIWDRNWGGQLLYGEDSFVSPKPNRCVIMDRTTPHAVARTSWTAPYRMCLQGWILNGTRNQYDFDK